MAARSRKGGGKLSRSEIISVRFDSRLRFAADLAAAKQRRTLSSFIEWAVERAVKATVPGEGLDEKSVWEVVSEVWDVDESDRLVNLAFKFPQYLTPDEHALWKLICETPAFWVLSSKSSNYPGDGTRKSELIVRPKLREHWTLVKDVFAGHQPREALNAIKSRSLKNA